MVSVEQYSSLYVILITHNKALLLQPWLCLVFGVVTRSYWNLTFLSLSSETESWRRDERVVNPERQHENFAQGNTSVLPLVVLLLILSECVIASSFAFLSWHLKQYVQRLPSYEPTLCESFSRSSCQKDYHFCASIGVFLGWGKRRTWIEFKWAVPGYEFDPVYSLKNVFHQVIQLTACPFEWGGSADIIQHRGICFARPEVYWKA